MSCSHGENHHLGGTCSHKTQWTEVCMFIRKEAGGLSPRALQCLDGKTDGREDSCIIGEWEGLASKVRIETASSRIQKREQVEEEELSLCVWHCWWAVSPRNGADSGQGVDFGGTVKAKSGLEEVPERRQIQTVLWRKFTVKGSREMI